MNLNSIRAFFAKGNRAKWFVFTLFCIVLFIKTMIFHLSVGFGILVSSLWKQPNEFFMFWGGKIVPILFLGAFVFITKKQWWTIVINVLVDLWAIANLFYFKANNLFISVDVALMVDNLDGFWDSLYSYMGWDIYFFPILTLFFIGTMVILKVSTSSNRILPVFLFAIVLSLLIHCHIAKQFQKGWETSNPVCYAPFGDIYYMGTALEWVDFETLIPKYIKTRSVISYFPGAILYHFISPGHGEIIQLSTDDIKTVKKYIRQNSCFKSPKTNIILILFESLESWSLNEIRNFNYLPNLTNLLNHEHTLFCDKIKSQIKHGHSADGQMTCITGLLPINQGASCVLYGNNEYPNFTHFFNNSAVINPWPGVWRQSIVTYSYKFKELIEPQKECSWHGDEFTLNKIIEYSTTVEEPFCTLGITIDTHVPFKNGSEHPVHIVEGMPHTMSAYLNSLYYTDLCVGNLLDTILNSHLAENTTIVITGDHTIFSSETAFKDMTEYAQENGINFRSGHTFTPLIIYSPEIEGNIHVTDTCYQMDIFPTILNLIGAEDYFWHGFGVNVMDSVARHNRPITEEEAYRLSDLMIRSDYFRNYYNPVDSAGNDR